MLSTETPSNLHADLDLYGTQDLVCALVDDHAYAARAVQMAAASLAKAVEAAVPRMLSGGRLV